MIRQPDAAASHISWRRNRLGTNWNPNSDVRQMAMVEGAGFEPAYVRDGQIYSLLPLTTRPPLHGRSSRQVRLAKQAREMAGRRA